MSGTMWWGRTYWNPPPQVVDQWQSGWLNLKGKLWGPGYGKLAALDQQWYTHNMLSQFWMSPHRMPPSDYRSPTFSSRPIFEIRGQIEGYTNVSTGWDNPDLTCKLILKQTAYYGNYKVAQDRNSRVLFDLPEKPHQRDTKIFTPHPRTFSFPHIQFDIRRNETLHIDLRAKIRIYLEGWAWLEFKPNFEMHTPQWEIW